MTQNLDPAHAAHWLTKLADHLATVETAPEGIMLKFDMNWWVLDGGESCGTSACAIGHGFLGDVLPPELTLCPSTTPGSFAWVPTLIGEDQTDPFMMNDYERIAKAYRIDSDHAVRMFSPVEYDGENPSINEVTARIRAFVAAQVDLAASSADGVTP